MDFPPVGFIRRRAVIFDLDTVSRLFHLLTPEPLHHPTDWDRQEAACGCRWWAAVAGEAHGPGPGE